MVVPDRIWASRVINQIATRSSIPPVIANLVSIGAVPIVLTVLYFTIASGYSKTFLLTHVLLTCLLSGMGYLVWYYDEHVLPEFISNINRITGPEWDQASKRVVRFYRSDWWKTAIGYGVLAPIAFAANFGFYQTQGVGEAGSLSFMLYLSFSLWTSLTSSLGIHLILTTLLAVSRVTETDLQIDPLHADGLGGLGFIGEYCVSTMGIASFGALAFPYAFQLATGGSFEAVVYLGVGLYVIILIAIFVYPTVQASQRAERKRESELESLRFQIDKIETELEQAENRADGMPDTLVKKELELQRLREKYNDYRSVRLYPISIGVIARFAGSVLLPLIFLLLEFYLPKFL